MSEERLDWPKAAPLCPVYEVALQAKAPAADRLVVLEHDGERESSLADDPELLEREHGLVVHARCPDDVAPSTPKG